jgi:hypothetical protein
MNPISPTPEQLERQKLGIKLEGIFMPTARKQRDDFYRNALTPETHADSARFVHYTTAEAALSIVSNKRIWMRNTLCMTDYREVQHGFEMLQKFFSNEQKTAEFRAALDACVPGAADEAFNMFNQWWNDIRFHTYITSISEHHPKEDTHGRLSMWRGFGTQSNPRVALVLNIPWFTGASQALNVLFSPVAYPTEEETHAQIYTVIRNISASCEFLRSVGREFVVNSVFIMLMTGVTCLKHEGFREEREWRAIYAPHRNPSAYMKPASKVIHGVPQIVYELPFDETVAPEVAGLEFSRVFDRLIIGPTQYAWPMYEAFRDALDKAGVPPEAEQQRIFVSGIPIRS